MTKSSFLLYRINLKRIKNKVMTNVLFKPHKAYRSPSRMFTKVSAMSTTTLDNEVDSAEEKYLVFRNRLRSLISTLKSHHGAIVTLNEAQEKVRQNFDLYFQAQVCSILTTYQSVLLCIQIITI